MCRGEHNPRFKRKQITITFNIKEKLKFVTKLEAIYLTIKWNAEQQCGRDF